EQEDHGLGLGRATVRLLRRQRIGPRALLVQQRRQRQAAEAAEGVAEEFAPRARDQDVGRHHISRLFPRLPSPLVGRCRGGGGVFFFFFSAPLPRRCISFLFASLPHASSQSTYRNALRLNTARANSRSGCRLRNVRASSFSFAVGARPAASR